MREIDLHTAVNEIVTSTLRRREKGEDFPFFFIVGAGISYPPIPLAAGIEKSCLETLTAAGIDIPPLDKKSALDRYQTLFERAHPQAEDRQDFLHDLIHRKPISAANFRLAHLMGELKLTNLIFTTNFDEMLSRALHLLGYDVVVCDHPKTTVRIRPAQKDLPQVIHVHGTHWYYDCCNLKGEIESQARLDLGDSLSMGQLLDRVLADRSPLVIGYSGWEGDVIMSAIRRRLALPTLPRNLYWFCYRRQDADVLPSWLRDHNSVRLILPPLPLKEKRPTTPKEERRAEKAGEFRADESLERESVFPAREILEAFIRKLKLGAPLLTQDPLKFFSGQLAASLLLEEEEGEDLYLLQQVISRVRKSADRDTEERLLNTERDRSNAEALSRLSDAVRRLAYKEALEIADHIDRSALAPEQRASLNTALEQSAKALISEAIALWNAGRLDEEVAVYDEVVAHFGNSPEPALREQVAKALVYKGVTLGQLRRSDEAVAVYEEVVARFADSPETALREQVAQALFNKGVRLGQLGRSDEAVAVYEEVVARFADSPETALRGSVAKALDNLSSVLLTNQRFPEALKAAQQAVSLGARRYNLACALARMGKVDEAMTELEGCLSRGEISREHVLKDPDWEALRENPKFKELTKEPKGA